METKSQYASTLRLNFPKICLGNHKIYFVLLKQICHGYVSDSCDSRHAETLAAFQSAYYSSKECKNSTQPLKMHSVMRYVTYGSV